MLGLKSGPDISVATIVDMYGVELLLPLRGGGIDSPYNTPERTVMAGIVLVGFLLIVVLLISICVMDGMNMKENLWWMVMILHLCRCS